MALDTHLRTDYGEFATFDGVNLHFSSAMSTRDQSTLSSVKTPGWKTMTKAQKRLVFNNFSYQKLFHSFAGGELRVIRSAPDWIPSTTYHLGPVTNFPTFLNVENVDGTIAFPENDAYSIALSKIQSKIARASVDLATAYAERKQSVDMIYNRVKQLIELARAIRKGDLIQAGKVVSRYGVNPRSKGSRSRGSQALSNHWLEYQYGWKPLMGDIWGAMEAIANSHYAPQPLRFSSQHRTEKTQEGFRLRAGTPGTNVYWALDLDYVCEDRVAFLINVSEETSVLQALASTGVTNPLNVAWEIIPYSFVVDWFVPVGAYLQQLEYARGLTFHSGTVSIRRDLQGGTRFVASGVDVPAGIDVVKQQLYPGHFSQYSKSRSVLGGFPYQEFPTFKPQLGVSRVTSAISLLTQVLTGGNPARR